MGAPSCVGFSGSYNPEVRFWGIFEARFCGDIPWTMALTQAFLHGRSLQKKSLPELTTRIPWISSIKSPTSIGFDPHFSVQNPRPYVRTSFYSGKVCGFLKVWIPGMPPWFLREAQKILYNHQTNLVGGWATPLKNMTSSIGMISIPNIWENKIHGNQTTNQ